MAAVTIKGDLSDAIAPAPALALPALASTPEQRRALAKAQAEAKPKAVRFVPAPGCDWADSATGGRVCVCNSAPNAAGEVFQYLVYQRNGREHAIPLAAVYEAEEAGQL